jgi:hypothetical protein
MNGVIMRKVVVQASYTNLVAESRLVGCVTISCPPTNAAVVYFKGDDGSDVPWAAAEWHDFQNVNLADFQLKGSPGDVVTIVGATC